MAAQTNFIDIATIWLHAGKGGDGAVSFHREKFVAAGGPDGGDGGRGGHVFAVADPNLNTLVDYRYSRRHEARRGEHGMGSDMFGAAGDDITLRLPAGTTLSDAETGEQLFELLVPGEVITIAKGGDGGFGNMRFKSAINRAPLSRIAFSRSSRNCRRSASSSGDGSIVGSLGSNSADLR